MINTELDKDANVYFKALDKDKFIGILKDGIPKEFIPISDTPAIINQRCQFSKPSDKIDDNFYYTFLNLIIGWRLNRKVFKIPNDVLETFAEPASKEETYYDHKEFIFPKTLLDSFPYWTTCVSVNRNFNINITSQGSDLSPTIINFSCDQLLYGVRVDKGKKYLHVICYITRMDQHEGEVVKIPDVIHFYYNIVECENKNIYSLEYNSETISDKEIHLLHSVLLSVLNGFITNVMMYVATMNKHHPTPFTHKECSLRRLGNKYSIPNPGLQEVLIGNHDTIEVKVLNGIRGKKSHLKTHMRIGYWRRQWYGPKSQPELRTMDLIFIPPCIVRGFNEEV